MDKENDMPKSILELPVNCDTQTRHRMERQFRRQQRADITEARRRNERRILATELLDWHNPVDIEETETAPLMDYQEPPKDGVVRFRNDRYLVILHYKGEKVMAAHCR